MEKLIKALVKGLTFTTPDGDEVTINDLANLSATDLRTMGLKVKEQIKGFTGEGDPDFGSADKKIPQSLIVKKDVIKGFLDFKENEAKKGATARKAKETLAIVKEAAKEQELAKLRGLSEKENKAKQAELEAVIAANEDDDEWE